MFEEIKYYFLTTYRRKALDKALNEYQYLFKGNVLDIGGGKKDGKFKHPRTKKWIVVDIDKKTKPDIVASVAKLPFKDEIFEEQGYFFTLISEILRAAITNMPWILLRYPLYLLFPFFDLLTYLDSTILVQNSKFLKSYVCGYFIFFKKS